MLLGDFGVLSGSRFVRKQSCEGQTDCAHSRKGEIYMGRIGFIPRASASIFSTF